MSRPRNPGSYRSIAAEKRRNRLRELSAFARAQGYGVWSTIDAPLANPRPWRCNHVECTAVERLFLRTGHRTITVSAAAILGARDAIRELHPAPRFPITKALAWRFGISVGSVRKGLAIARRACLAPPPPPAGVGTARDPHPRLRPRRLHLGQLREERRLRLQGQEFCQGWHRQRGAERR